MIKYLMTSFTLVILTSTSFATNHTVDVKLATQYFQTLTQMKPSTQVTFQFRCPNQKSEDFSTTTGNMKNHFKDVYNYNKELQFGITHAADFCNTKNQPAISDFMFSVKSDQEDIIKCSAASTHPANGSYDINGDMNACYIEPHKM